MSKRRFAVKPLEPLILEFADGVEKEVVMSIDALMILFEEFGDLTKLMEEEFNRPIDLASKILYAGMKVMDSSITLEEVRGIMIGGGIPLQMEIISLLTDSLGEMSEGELKKTLTPLINRMLARKTRVPE